MKSAIPSLFSLSVGSLFLLACSGGGGGGFYDGGATGGFANSATGGGAGTTAGSGGSAFGGSGNTPGTGGASGTGAGGGASGGTAGTAGAATGGTGGGNCTVCPKGCVDLDSDPQNCGSCGYACPVSVPGAVAVCQAGQCNQQCTAAGQTICGGQCVDTSNNPDHCGGCDNYCDDPYGGTATCVGGACKDNCPAGTALCGSECVTLSTDNQHCGTCGNDCSALTPPTGGSPYACQAGKCVTSCPTGQTQCGNKCVNLTTDNLNCGSCGKTCYGNFACSSGTCSTSQCAYDACYVDNQYSSGTHLECCDATENCNFFWLNDINGVPKKHYYCG